MEITEIVLLVAGGIIFILSFLIPAQKGEASEQSRELVKEEIADMVSREMESVRGQVDGVVEEAVTYAMEKTERSLERLSNEKIMAVSEYSDTVLAEIHKNHEEAMFLYDMLNSKHNSIKDTAAEVNRTVKEVEEKVSRLQEMTNVSVASKVSPAVERVAEHSTVQPVRLQEFRPAVLPKAEPSAAQSVNAVPSALEKLAMISAQKTARPATAATAAVPVTPTPIPAETAAVPVTPTPILAAAAAVPVTPTPIPAETAAVPVTPTPIPTETATVTAGRVSVLQEGAAEGQNNNERILELYRQGKSKVAIAKELGLGVGEVKLVIELFRNQ